MTHVISLLDVADKVLELAEQYPDGKYEHGGNSGACRYTVGRVFNGPDTEGCIVGQVLVRTAPALHRNLVAADTIPHGIVGLLRVLQLKGWQKHLRLLVALKAVQLYQDAGETWSHAVRELTPLMEALSRNSVCTVAVPRITYKHHAAQRAHTATAS